MLKPKVKKSKAACRMPLPAQKSKKAAAGDDEDDEDDDGEEEEEEDEEQEGSLKKNIMSLAKPSDFIRKYYKNYITILD